MMTDVLDSATISEIGSQRLLIIEYFLALPSFPGWRSEKLYQHFQEKYSKLEWSILFPYGNSSLISTFHDYLSQDFTNRRKKMPVEINKTTAKIQWLIQQRFEQFYLYEELLRSLPKTIGDHYLKTPGHIASLMDQIWSAAGDESTDMNYYTKRISLGGVYMTCVAYWYAAHPSLPELILFFNHRIKDLHNGTRIMKKTSDLPKHLLRNGKILYSFFKAT
jgi:ubiquinone biosynthesis protein COQ9